MNAIMNRRNRFTVRFCHSKVKENNYAMATETAQKHNLKKYQCQPDDT